MLALVALMPVLPLLVLCFRFGARYSAASRQAQDQAGDLTTSVAESVLGIRVIKGFGQHRSRILPFREQARRLRGTELRKAELLASISVLIMTLPGLATAAALGLSSGVADPDDVRVQEELIRELRGLRTMDGGDTPRIYPQAEFQPGGTYWDLAEQVGLGD